MAEMNLHIHAKDMECPGCFREGLEAGLAKHQWQPIEAAPKEPGSRLLLHEMGTGWVVVGHWWSKRGTWQPEQGYSPTHWMPLPPLPEGE